MSQLFETIAKVQPGLPGWCCPEKAEALAAMVLSIRPQNTVELGVFGGSSFIPLALAHKEIGTGVAWGIDPWSKQASIKDEIPENVEFWSRVDHEWMYSQFMAKLRELSLESCTRIIRQTSDEADPPSVIDVLHLDGSHTEQAVRDVIKWMPHVRSGGFAVLDDLEWSGGGVKRAEARLLDMGFKRLYPLGTGACYQRA